MECVCPILEKIGGYLVSPIADQLGFLFNYNENIEVYRNQLKKLGNMREGVQQLVDVAKRNGEEIRIHVRSWLTEVDDIIEKEGNLDERINANKGCLNGWCPNWGSMYKLSREVTKKTLIVMQLQGDVPRENVSLPAPLPCVDLISNKDFVTALSSKSTMKQIMKLLKDDGCDIIGVYGMGGIGKTTLVTAVCKKAEEDKLFDKVVMSVVSQNSDLKKIQGQIADMLGLKFNEESEQGRTGRLYDSLMKNKKRILIILDDVWAPIGLEKIGIPHGADRPGWKVIITTRRESVCSAMGSRTKKIRLSLLSTEESWNLFREKAGAIVDSSMLNGVAIEVAKECGRLPLALVTVGRALHDKEELEEWKSALKQLKKSTPLTMDESEQRIFSCIKLSYDYITKDEIKIFFLFCCLFPEDYEIAIETLARFGMGKGLFTDTDIIDTMADARIRAHAVTKYLKASCLLLGGGDDDAGKVKMHDVVRDVGISIVSTEKNNSFLIRAGVGLKEWPNKEIFEHYTAISLMCNDIQKLPEGLKCPNLQILLLGYNKGLQEIPDTFFKGMPELRVLDLGECPTLLTLSPSFELLTQLRTLHLDCCKFRSSISIIGKLRKLEILSLVGSDIKELPKEIGELINLRLLDLSMCDELQKIPANVISSITQLEELYMIESFWKWAVEGTEEEKTSACLSELKSLPRLLILCVDLIDPACFPRQLLLQNLLKYHISVGGRSINFHGELYPTSRSLYVQGIKPPLPGWIKTLFKSDLVKTELSSFVEGSINEIFDVDGGGPIGLKSLHLSHCDNMLSLRISKNSSEASVMFTSLEYLCIWEMKSMSFISDSCSDASFTKLRELDVQVCERLKFLFSYSVAQSLLQLETLVVFGCENLERIIAEAEEEEGGASSSSSSSRSHTQPIIAFPNLRAGEITFPKLKRLTLVWLPSLKRLCSETSSVNMPCLEELFVSDCRMMENLSTDPAAYGLKSAPKLKFLLNRTSGWESYK